MGATTRKTISTQTVRKNKRICLLNMIYLRRNTDACMKNWYWHFQAKFRVVSCHFCQLFIYFFFLSKKWNCLAHTHTHTYPLPSPPYDWKPVALYEFSLNMWPGHLILGALDIFDKFCKHGTFRRIPRHILGKHTRTALEHDAIFVFYRDPLIKFFIWILWYWNGTSFVHAV